MLLHGLLGSTGSPLGLVLPLLHAVGFALAALLLVGYHLASRRVALMCFGAALVLVILLHWTALSMQYWYWKMLMTQWREMPYVILAPLTTVALVVSPAIRSRYRGNAAGVELHRAELATLNARFLAIAVFVGAALQVMLRVSDRWDPETHLRFSEAHPAVSTLLWTLALASAGASYSWLARGRTVAHRTIGGAVAGGLARAGWLAQSIPSWSHSLRSHLVGLDELVVSVAFALVLAGVYSGMAALLAAYLPHSTSMTSAHRQTRGPRS